MNVNTNGQTVTCSATDNAGNTASQLGDDQGDETAPTGQPDCTGRRHFRRRDRDGERELGRRGLRRQRTRRSSTRLQPSSTWTQIGAPDTSSPYSVNWNAGALAQGNYDLRVITTDNAGNTFTSPTRTVFVDSTPPTVAITFPADGGAYNATGYNAGCVTNQVCGTAADLLPARSTTSRSRSGVRATTATGTEPRGRARSSGRPRAQNLDGERDDVLEPGCSPRRACRTT